MNVGNMVVSRRFARRQFIQMCAGTLALAAVGCGHGNEGAWDRRSTITVLYPSEELWGLPALFLLFLPLMRRNTKGDLEGWLAKSWEHSADYREWTCHLRKDIRWHDGVPVTAQDVKFSLDLFANSALAWESPDEYSVSVLDDRSYSIIFHKRPVDWWKDYMVFYPRHLLENLDPKKFYEWEFWKHPVGNGPYRYVRSMPKTMMELEANPDYYRGKPKIDRVVLKFGEPMLTELLSGNVDVIPWVKEMDLLKITGDPRFRAYSTVEPDHIRALVWNQRCPLFRDAKIRRALTLAINRQELHQVLNLPKETPVFDVIFTREQFRRGELPVPLPYDPSAARRLLDEAHWRDTDGDGIRDREGKSFHFTALVKTEEDLDKAAVYIQAELRRVGIRMDISALEAETAAARIKTGDFEAAVTIVNEDIEGPGGHIEFFGEGSLIGYRNSRVAALLNQAAKSLNPGESDRIYRELAPIFRAALPATFLFPLVRTTVAHRRVRGMSSPYREDPVWYMDELWLDDRSA